MYFLKQLADARAIRGRIIECFEQASYPGTPQAEQARLLSFLVVGGGPTSVELSSELYDFLKKVTSGGRRLVCRCASRYIRHNRAKNPPANAPPNTPSGRAQVLPGLGGERVEKGYTTQIKSNHGSFLLDLTRPSANRTK